MVRQSDGTRQREKADRLRRELSQLGVLMRDSLVHSRGKCGKANCRCARGQLHQWWSLSFRAGGKSRSVTVPPELLGEVRQWCGNCQKLKGLVVELSDALVAVIRAGIESGIHALMAGNGLDRCRDRGEAGYERYVALAVLGRNLHTLGRVVLKKSRRKRNAG